MYYDNPTEGFFPIAMEICRAEEEFLERWLKPILPPVVFRWSKERKHVQFCVKYMRRHGIGIVICPDHKVLMHGGVKVAEFRYQITK